MVQITLFRYKLKYGEVRLTTPTERAQSEEIVGAILVVVLLIPSKVLGNLKLRAFDLGGHEQVRNFWSEYFGQTDAIMFLVDSADPDRLDEAQQVSLTKLTYLYNFHLKGTARFTFNK